MFLTAYLALAASLADGASNGKLGSGDPYCWNVDSGIGCHPNDWTSGDRLRCTTSLPMNWAMMPRYSSAFSLETVPRTKTQYVPGEWITIVLRVRRYPFKFRGLALHAANASMSHVGEWRSAGNDVENRMFWTPTPKKECIMHVHADLKPLRNTFRFKAPPSGTLTFKALIKTGPANEGYFFFPNGNNLNVYDTIPAGGFPGTGTQLQLTEDTTQRQRKVWSVGGLGKSCVEHCKSMDLKCDVKRMRSRNFNTPSGLESISGITGCPKPYFPSCASVSPAIDANGTCWFSGVDSSLRNVCVGDTKRDIWGSSCFSKHPQARRMCACTPNGDIVAIPDPTQAPTQAPSQAPATSGSTSARVLKSTLEGSRALERTRETMYADTTEGASIAVGLSVALPLALFSMAVRGLLKRSSTAGGIGVFVMGLLAMSQPAHSHNWLHTEGRASREASTTNPWRQRRSTDIHAQLGPGQRMAVKWASGHSRPHYWVTFNGAHEKMAYNNDYKKWVKEYIDEGLARNDVTNMAPNMPRLHHCRNDADCESQTNYFAGEVQQGDQHYCNKAQGDGSFHRVFRWKAQHISSDVFVRYKNDKYPFILQAGRYDNVAHMPADYDVICMSIPKEQGMGFHHIVHWFWNGYYDAVDVHVHDEQIPEELIYGNDTNSYEITKIDHCQFVKPQALTTPIQDATNNTESCLDMLAEVSKRHPGSIDGTLGVNVIPVVNPSSVEVDVRPVRNLPLNLTGKPEVNDHFWPSDYFPIAFKSPLMDHPGTVSQTTYNWTAWGSPQPRKRCRQRLAFKSHLSEAISECEQRPTCWGISWRGYNPSYGIADGGDYWVCGDNGASNARDLTDNASWDFYQKPASPTPTNYDAPNTWNANAYWASGSKSHRSYKVSFQPRDGETTYSGSPVNITFPNMDEWLIDNGDAYGSKTSSGYPSAVSYGWKCPVSMTLLTRNPTLNVNAMTPETGYVHRSAWRAQCQGGINEWEIAVPNGVYVVTIYTGSGSGQLRGVGCACEQRRFLGRRFEQQYNTKSFAVQVNDGRLTLTSIGGKSRIKEDTTNTDLMFCPDVNWLRIDWLQDNFPPAWMPPAPTEAWWQKQLDNPSLGVGYVFIALPYAVSHEYNANNNFYKSNFPFPYYTRDENSVQSWFFEPSPVNDYQTAYYLENRNRAGNPDLYITASSNPNSFFNTNNPGRKEQDPLQVWGTYNDDGNHGAVVSLADTPCTQSGGCPGKGSEKVCAVLLRAPNCHYDIYGHRMCPFMIDCKGKTGNYLRIRLKGSNRVLMVRDIKVYRKDLPPIAAPPGKRPMVCYGVEARTATETAPEFIITEDPSDPIFYSTCFIRSKKIDWLPIPSETPPPPRWNFNGQCVACDTFRTNKDLAIPTTPHWHLDNTCRTCEGEMAIWGQGRLHAANPGKVKWKVRMVLSMDITQVSERFKARFRAHMANFLEIPLDLVGVTYTAGSVNAEVTIEEDNEPAAKKLSETPIPQLETALNLTAGSISNVNEPLYEETDQGSSTSADGGGGDQASTMIIGASLAVVLFLLGAAAGAWCLFRRYSKSDGRSKDSIMRLNIVKSDDVRDMQAQQAPKGYDDVDRKDTNDGTLDALGVPHVGGRSPSFSGDSAAESADENEGEGDWTQYFDNTGKPYWHNAITGESTWDNPAATPRTGQNPTSI